MKKRKILSIIALVFCVALMLTGCSTVSAVLGPNGKPIYYNEAVYYEGNIAVVGDYIYYGNSYVATSTEGFNYKNAAKKAYLARIKNKDNFTFASNVENADFSHTSPKGIETVNKDKLAGYENQKMYVLGQYLYFTSANTHKNSELANDYSQITLFRVKFDGDGLKEIATFKNDEKSEISLVKGSDGEYYFVAVAPSKENYSIYSVKVGKNVGKVETLVENVTSAAIADENSSLKNVIYTVDADKDLATTKVKSVDFATGDVEPLDNQVAGSTTTILGREGDVVFYSYTNPENKVKEVYQTSITSTNTSFSPTNNFYNAETISNIQTAGEGYIFETESGALVYKTLSGTMQLLLNSTEFSDVLFVDGEYVYTSTENSISRVSTNNYEVEEIISEVIMISGECGYDGDYIYFYAQLGNNEEEQGEEEISTDENYYMYRTDKEGKLQLISKTAKK